MKLTDRGASGYAEPAGGADPGGVEEPRHGGARRFAGAAALAAVALAAALLHLIPLWHAERSTPEGWRFTGNLSASPDFMQYRLWMRQAPIEGALVDNRFTTEPNRPYLPVVFYRFVGTIARAADASPEWTMELVGAALAAGLVLLLALVTRTFVASRCAGWWTLGALILGGGLGAHLKLAKAVVLWWRERGAPVAAATGGEEAAGPVTWMLAENYRGSYVVTTLFDTHFLALWIPPIVALLAFHRAMVAPKASRTVIAALLFAITTALHVHEGVTLIAIVAACIGLGWLKGLPLRPLLRDGVLCSAAAGGVLAGFLFLQHRSELPLSDWSAIPVPLSILFLAHPLAWALVAWGIGSYWRSAGASEIFLLGWALGCTLETQSNPFYPNSERGLMTLQVPLVLVAGTIWFRARPRLTLPAFAVAVLLLGATPIWMAQRIWRAGEFSPHQPHKWLSAAERATIDALRRLAGPEDVLLAEPKQARWLAPDYPGRFYVAHFFLTVDFERKRSEYESFCAGVGVDRQRFVAAHQIRFVHLLERCAPLAAADAAGFRIVNRDDEGMLLERLDERGG